MFSNYGPGKRPGVDKRKKMKSRQNREPLFLNSGYSDYCIFDRGWIQDFTKQEGVNILIILNLVVIDLDHRISDVAW